MCNVFRCLLPSKIHNYYYRVRGGGGVKFANKLFMMTCTDRCISTNSYSGLKIMCAWRGFPFSHARWSAMLRLSHVLQATKTPLTSAMATTGRVGCVCEGCGLTFLRRKR